VVTIIPLLKEGGNPKETFYSRISNDEVLFPTPSCNAQKDETREL
jgi:hypothetical protein